MLSYIIPFLILILVVVFIHEYGHYYFARKYGVGVTDFSIGFGKELFGWNDKSGTRWKICAIPLGGYVKFFGDRNVYSQSDHQEILEKYNEEEREKLFILKPLYQRVLIVFGGPLANFLLALVIFFSIYTFVGKDFTPAVINEVQKDSPAMMGGLKNQDVILEIDYKGMLAIKSKIPKAKSIYIIPPSIEELEKRLIDRGLDSTSVIHKRVSQAEDELHYVKFADFTIVNDNFSQACQSLKSLILLAKLESYDSIKH